MKISTCDILPSNYTCSLGHLMGSLKWGKVTVIVVVGQDWWVGRDLDTGRHQYHPGVKGPCARFPPKLCLCDISVGELSKWSLRIRAHCILCSSAPSLVVGEQAVTCFVCICLSTSYTGNMRSLTSCNSDCNNMKSRSIFIVIKSRRGRRLSVIDGAQAEWHVPR